MNPILLSFKYFATVDNIQVNYLWYGFLNCLDGPGNYFGLCYQIYYFQYAESKAMKMPLKYLYKMKLKYSDTIQILAFAFTSVVQNLLGNYTFEWSQAHNTLFLKCNAHLLLRSADMKESLFDDQNVALRFENKFSSLRFVSCGSRGLESLQFHQFVSVFQSNLWVGMLTAAIVQIVAMNMLRGSICPLNSIEKIICLIKVMLEQSDPFSERFIKSGAFRLLICGTLMGGLVLSNAFKSTNVYNIVLPKHILGFNTIEELAANEYSVYTKLVSIGYYLHEFKYIPLSTEAVLDIVGPFKLFKIYTADHKLIFQGRSELDSYYSLVTINAKKVTITTKILCYFCPTIQGRI